ncbi:SpoIIE family protein phosphatase [Streptomyces sp. ISL-96]|uniref:ATP-binding SpoIIE family protein phosphatase n=1 Tax=Streptomyces sp. ISL-96 TaxID=2819191 RepID=UPI001BE92BD6|nr:SpoIIE family protein phosphatase [Streptomyces sp. ISL-96]MBT2491629.1 SpoIIE family protein phosphatase [Streptomyces sp. ISL-96]
MEAVVPRQRAVSGRIPLAVVVVGGDGLVSHWSSGAHRLFGHRRQDAVGALAADLLPVSGALTALYEYDDFADQLTAGRAKCPRPDGGSQQGADSGSLDVLWWAYPLAGPGPERLLVLAADASRLGDDGDPHERVAPGFALHTEFPGAGLLAERLPDILPHMGPATAGRIVSQVLELGYPVLEISTYERVPVTPDWGVPKHRERRTRTAPVRGGGPADLGRPPIDADLDKDLDLEYAAVRERLEFLNEVSGRIGSSLDLARTIREVTSAAVPRFADFAGTHLRVQILAGEGFPDGPPDVNTDWRRVWVEHNDEPGRWDDTVPVGEEMTFPEQTPFFQCMVTGEPVLLPRIGNDLSERISAQFEKRDLRPLIGGRSLLVVPLTARRVVLGFTVLMRRPGREPFTDMDRRTGAELAARAGLVLDNARMYAYQQQVAETLQESMLPQVEPRMAGCDVATRYLPGTALGRVGGDWFDTIRLPGSRTALVVGDVMGHGLNAAAMMGQLRTAVHTMAVLDIPPAQLLRKLDDLAHQLGDHYLATCLYAVYDPVAGELLISSAGHLPPVLVRAESGRGELIDVPGGALIGLGGVPFATARVSVSPGDRLVLCTDGLVEVRGEDIGTGLAALCESAAHPAASMDEACDTIIRALAVSTAGESGGRKDDIALLMARLNGMPPEDMTTWQLAPTAADVRRARQLVDAQLARWGLPELADTTLLLVSEVVTNAVRHAGGRPVGLRLVRADTLLCEVSDEEHTLPVLREAGPDEECGRGLRLVSRLADRWGASHMGRGKVVWFEQPLPPGARSGVRDG